MAQYIIFELNGKVGVCFPNPEHDINWVMQKDCPPGAVILGEEDLDMNDMLFIDAFRLVNGQLQIDMPTAIAVQNANLNSIAKREAQHRFTNTACGIDNVLTDAEWLTMLTATRTAFATATTTQQLRDAISQVESAIQANK